jgi:hypothetical protein
VREISDRLGEQVARRRFMSRIGKVAFAGSAAIGGLLASPKPAFARTCNCCTLSYSTNCSHGQQRSCKSHYAWTCTESSGGCTCTCYECYSHLCSLGTCSGSGCSSAGC